jgi:predicted transposase/invertase (TIGR01784 family)
MSKQLIRFDWAMKRLLRSKANFGILEGFLSELLKRDLKILEVLESESNKDNEDIKFNKVDILVKLSDGEIVLVEVQTSTESDYFCRMLFGTSKIVTDHLKEGEPYLNIKKIYSVNILYFDLGHGTDYVYHGTTSFTGIHNHDQLSLSEKQKRVYQKERIHQIYPEYYLIKVDQFNDVAKDTLDEWIYFLKNESIKDNFHAKGLVEAKEKLDSLKLSEPDKQKYKKYMENLSYQKSMIVSNYTDGKIEGLDEGMKKGKNERTIEVAKKMKNMGLSIEVIQQATDLSVDEITRIKS